MKRILLILLCLSFASLSLFADYGRNTVQLSAIGRPVARIDKATGWMQSPSGEWIQRERRIVKYLSSDYNALLDYERYGLGVDNFNWIELREITIDGKTFNLLLRSRSGGSYQYPRIKKDWEQNYQIKGYVFNKGDWKAKFVDRKPYLLRLKLKCVVGLVYYTEPSEKQYIQDMCRKINEQPHKDNEKFANYLNINTLLIGTAVRFIFIEESVYTTGQYSSTTHSGLFELRDLPINIKETVTPKVFEKFYFETDYTAFSKLFPE